MSDEDLPSIFGSISALKAVTPKAEGPQDGELRADATLLERLGSGLKGYHYRGELRGETVGVHVLRERVTEVGRAAFQEAIDSFVKALRGKSAPSILKPGSLAADRTAFTTRLCTGGSLADVTEAHPWSLGQRLVAIATVAEALEVLHTGGLTHGALSPAAVLLDEDGSPWIAGTAGTNLLVGTSGDSADPHTYHTYASPEARFGEPIDTRSDIYSLGRVLYFLLCGAHRLPRDDDSAKLGELEEKPAGLVRIVRKCTRREPSDRYQTIDGFLADLVKYSKHGEVGVRHSGVVELEVDEATVDPLLSLFDRGTKPVSKVILEMEDEPEPESRPSQEPAERRGRPFETLPTTLRRAIVIGGVALVVTAVLFSFLGGENGMIVVPVLALIGAGIAAMGLASRL
jgi:hypothetical protein